MTEYRSDITYIYFYTRGKKDRNVGFVRIDVREGKLKITISLKTPKEISAEKLKVYLYTRKDNDICGVNVGTIIPTSSNCKFKTTLDAANICASGLSVDDMAGVYISGNKGYAFFAQWDGASMEMSTFREYSTIYKMDDNKRISLIDNQDTKSSVIEIIKDYIKNEQKEQVINT
ncbi:MAG: hypothetical protein ACI4DS_07445 [Eubacterium sp.]